MKHLLADVRALSRGILRQPLIVGYVGGRSPACACKPSCFLCLLGAVCFVHCTGHALREIFPFRHKTTKKSFFASHRKWRHLRGSAFLVVTPPIFFTRPFKAPRSRVSKSVSVASSLQSPHFW